MEREVQGQKQKIQMLISRDVGLMSADEFSQTEQLVRQTSKLLTGLLRYAQTRYE